MLKLKPISLKIFYLLGTALLFSAGGNTFTHRTNEAILKTFDYTPTWMKQISSLNTNLTLADHLPRRKRAAFAWPTKTILDVQFNFQTDLPNPKGIHLPLKLNVPYKFDLSKLRHGTFNRQSRSLDYGRQSIFGFAESLFTRFGFDGKACISRTICERANTSFEPHGLIEEILNQILIVSAGGEGSEMAQYLEAEKRGNIYGDCSSEYSSCPFSLLTLFET